MEIVAHKRNAELDFELELEKTAFACSGASDEDLVDELAAVVLISSAEPLSGGGGERHDPCSRRAGLASLELAS